MNSEEGSRGMSNYQRRPMSHNKYEQKPTYNSPSSNYNYNNSHSNHSGYNGQQQQPKRRVDRFKRESINFNDKVMRQNDMIISLLKEIRDRLPPLPGSAVQASGFSSQDDIERTDTNCRDQDAACTSDCQQSYPDSDIDDESGTTSDAEFLDKNEPEVEPQQ